MKKLILPILLSLLLPVQSWAFPNNGVLETFTGADTANPPNANWINFVAGTAGNGIYIKTNAASNNGAQAVGSAYWVTTSFSADCEAYASLISVTSLTSARLFCRLANIGDGTTDGYMVLATTTVTQIYRYDNDTVTQLGADITQAFDAGDAIGMKTMGDQICAWFNDDGAGWTEIGCRTDATYSAGGFIGLAIHGAAATANIDNFGGGDAVAEPAGGLLQNSRGFLGGILR